MKYNVIDVDASSLQEKYQIGLLSAKLLMASHLSDEEIHEFCSLHFNTKFPHMHKSDVNGENELPLYTFLKSEKGFEGFTGEKADFMNAHVGNLVPNFRETSDIKWNFTKFLVDRKGNVVARFEPTADMADVEKAIQELL